jgi:hypothetical protein
MLANVGLVRIGAGLVMASSLFMAACSDDDDGGSGSATGGASSGGSATGGDSSYAGAPSGGSSTGGSSTGSGGAAAEATWGCLQEGASCIEYYGSTETVDNIAEASDCAGNGGTEVDECPKDDASICVLPDNGVVGSSQIYYGYEGDDAEVHQQICEAAGGTYEHT